MSYHKMFFFLIFPDFPILDDNYFFPCLPIDQILHLNSLKKFLQRHTHLPPMSTSNIELFLFPLLPLLVAIK